MRRKFHRLGKGKDAPVLAMEAYGGVNLGLHSFIISALDEGYWLTKGSDRFILRKEPRYLLKRRLGGPQSRSGYFGRLIIFSL
jgi:hypothetical protein